MRSEDLFEYHQYLSPIAEEDVRYLKEKDASYGASWKLGGGRSAWFMLRRKMDRMIQMMRRPDPPLGLSSEDILSLGRGPGRASTRKPRSSGNTTIDAPILDHLLLCYAAEDIFAKIAEDGSGRDGTVLAEVRDLRRYLLLVEAEMIARAVNHLDPRSSASSDGMEHPFGYDAEEEGHHL